MLLVVSLFLLKLFTSIRKYSNKSLISVSRKLNSYFISRRLIDGRDFNLTQVITTFILAKMFLLWINIFRSA